MSASPIRSDPVAPLVQRLVAASGIAFALLLIIALALSDAKTPEDDAALSEWTAFARDNEDDRRIGALAFALATYTFLLFLGYLRNAVGNAETAARGFTRAGYIVLSAGTAGISGLAIAVFIGAAVVAEPETPPETIRALFELSSAGLGLAAAGMGACFVTVGLVNAGVRALPPWLGWVALGCGLSFVLQLGVLLSEDEDNLFGIFFPIAFLLLVVFCAGASVTFLKDLNRAAVGASTPGPD
jgi:hypothetical protein